MEVLQISVYFQRALKKTLADTPTCVTASREKDFPRSFANFNTKHITPFNQIRRTFIITLTHMHIHTYTHSYRCGCFGDCRFFPKSFTGKVLFSYHEQHLRYLINITYTYILLYSLNLPVWRIDYSLALYIAYRFCAVDRNSRNMLLRWILLLLLFLLFFF